MKIKAKKVFKKPHLLEIRQLTLKISRQEWMDNGL